MRGSSTITDFEGAVCADGISVVLGRLEMLNHTVTGKSRPSARGVMSLDQWNSKDVCPPRTEGTGDFREHPGWSKDVFHDVLRDVQVDNSHRQMRAPPDFHNGSH